MSELDYPAGVALPLDTYVHGTRINGTAADRTAQSRLCVVNEGRGDMVSDNRATNDRFSATLVQSEPDPDLTAREHFYVGGSIGKHN